MTLVLQRTNPGLEDFSEITYQGSWNPRTVRM